MTLQSSVARLRGVGPILQRALSSAGIETIADLLDYYPRRWESYRVVDRINQIKPGLVSFGARVENVAMRRSHRHKRLTITEAILSDDTGTVRAVWFNQPYLAQTLKQGANYHFRGNFEYKNGYISLQTPNFEKPSNLASQPIIPIYPETKQLTSTMIRKLVAQCLDVSGQLQGILPSEIIIENQLLSRAEAVQILHQPKSDQDLANARRTISFEELFELILSGLMIKQNIQTEKTTQINYDPSVAKEFTSGLQFELTVAQKKAAHTILKDLDSMKPMNRLLEGDVGSGKTLVALMAATMTMRAGLQAALMVPTEILARQHYVSSRVLLEKLGIHSELLVSDMKKSERGATLDLIKTGKANLIIGTQALISSDVEYQNLGLVVVDEQHRFGVNQRAELRNKAKTMPHVLTMTATPIPRSLALVVYGDLDISVIDELPPGRKPIMTRLAKEMDRVHIYTHIDNLIGQGQQVYVVCPLISESDKLGVKSVEAEFERLNKSIFRHRRIGLVHGRLKADEKAKIMQQFLGGELDMLVTTSVIEVGVDAPNASVMIIEGAERFGLAALHQLRGRVGRGKAQSYCYMFTSSESLDTMKRLQALEKTADGFRLAQIDLEMRGPGEIYGTAQHGLLGLRMADLFDYKLIAEVREAVEAFISKHNLLEYPRLAECVDRLKSITSLD